MFFIPPNYITGNKFSKMLEEGQRICQFSKTFKDHINLRVGNI